jgi:uncharacterized protein (TIGR02996 family)
MQAMPDDGAFLRAIIENPDDDAPRLIYADWLEEQGRPDRAEFIRVQVALARLAENDPRRTELEARERGLLAAHEADWVRPLQAVADAWTFRRGFVETVTLHREPSSADLATLHRLGPVQEVVVLSGEGGE